MVSDQPSHHQAASLKGHFLIATPVIGSGFFNRSLTYLCDHGSEGAMGIVVNQCLEGGLADMLSHLEIDAVISCPDTAILAGRAGCDRSWLCAASRWCRLGR